MRSLSEYIIKFEGLKQGTHFYEFDVDNAFFEEFDCFEFKKSSFKIDLEFEKQSTIMLLTFNFTGTITVPCDRCLDDADVDVDGEEKLIVKFGNEEYDETDEILMLPIHEHEINVAKYIYEFINVNLPQKRVHFEGLCNQNVIDKLERIEQKEDINEDPRWSTLKGINLNKNK
ncbi:MAG: DUF177 domain-containing protein [Flavobacteriales bacterium]|nr:DUF177 domain-containing protein [Flavobacteriales bacterium]